MSENPVKIVICDDEESNARDRLEPMVEAGTRDAGATIAINVLRPDKFLDALGQLEERQMQSRAGSPIPADPESPIDTADLVIVDYDLLLLHTQKAGSNATSGLVTGDRVAYLLRCYSSCGPIAVLNQVSLQPTFDLTLRGYPWSYADVQISAKDLANPWLWHDQAGIGFRPWYWPSLLDAPGRLNAMASHVQQAFDENEEPTVLEFLGLNDVVDHFPREAASFFGVKGREGLRDAKLSDVLGGEHGLKPKDRPTKSSDSPRLDEAIRARLIAARIGTWLEQVVIPGQNILVDAPHLVARFPSLLGAEANSGAETNIETASLSATRQIDPVFTPDLSAHRVPSEWISRPVWVWPRVREDRTIAEVADPFSAKDPPFVFAEDVSRFVPEKEAEPFLTEVDSIYSRRWIFQNPDSAPGVSGVDYQPVVALFR